MFCRTHELLEHLFRVLLSRDIWLSLDKVSDQMMVLWLLHLYEHAAFIFTVAEVIGGGDYVDCIRRLQGFWLVRATEMVEGMVYCFRRFWTERESGIHYCVYAGTSRLHAEYK